MVISSSFKRIILHLLHNSLIRMISFWCLSLGLTIIHWVSSAAGRNDLMMVMVLSGLHLAVSSPCSDSLIPPLVLRFPSKLKSFNCIIDNLLAEAVLHASDQAWVTLFKLVFIEQSTKWLADLSYNFGYIDLVLLCFLKLRFKLMHLLNTKLYLNFIRFDLFDLLLDNQKGFLQGRL